MKRHFNPSTLFFAASAWMIFSAGCDRDSVKVYHVDANDAAPAPAPPSTMNAMPATMPAGLPAPDNSGLPKLKYTLPAGWTEKSPTQMRVASFAVSENGQQADVSVIPLGGMAGGDFANVNRWRGQVNLQPLADEELQKLAEKVEVAGLPADFYDIGATNSENGSGQRILATILHRDDTAWFFKMTGDSALVEKNKAAFIAFLKSTGFDGQTASAVQISSDAASGSPAWTVPAGWNETAPSQFLVAKFLISGGNGAQAAVNISSLTGDGGGLSANVNRWRGQLGLPAIAEILTTSFDVPNGKATVVDYTGTDARTGQPARLIGALVPVGNQTWFYKLMGDDAVVAREKDAFTKFIQSAKYPDAR